MIDKSDTEEVTQEQRNDWLYIIRSIGEPLIKNRILKCLNDKFLLLDNAELYNENMHLKSIIKKYKESEQISETIEVLTNKIEELQEHIKELEAKGNGEN